MKKTSKMLISTVIGIFMVSIVFAAALVIKNNEIELVIDYVERLRPDMVLERFVSQSPKELLIAPDWGLKNYEFTERVKKRMREREAYQGKLYRL